MSKESIYDEKIAPLMTKIIGICKEHDMAMFATYHLDDDLACTTDLRSSSGDIACMRHMRYLVMAGNNFDSFMFAVMRDAKQNGHSSVVLAQLGVPVKIANR